MDSEFLNVWRNVKQKFLWRDERHTKSSEREKSSKTSNCFDIETWNYFWKFVHQRWNVWEKLKLSTSCIVEYFIDCSRFTSKFKGWVFNFEHFIFFIFILFSLGFFSIIDFRLLRKFIERSQLDFLANLNFNVLSLIKANYTPETFSL